MIDPNMESYIVVGDETASVLNLIANSDLHLSADLLQHIVVSKSDFAAFLKETKLEADPEAIAILELLEDASAERDTRIAAAFDEPFEKKTLGDAEWLDKNAEHHLEEGRFRDAERLYLDSLSIRVYLFGGEHPEAAVGYNNLGELYHVSRRFANAEEQYIHALSIHEKELGDHPETAVILNNLAELYAKKGNLQQAESFYMNALAIREKVFGPKHHRTAEILNNLGALYHNMGDYAAAESLYRKAIEVFEDKLGHENPSTKIVRDNLLELQESRVTSQSRKRSTEEMPPPGAGPK